MPYKLNPFTGELNYYEKSSSIISVPPVTMCVVKNMYVDPVGNKLMIKWDDVPGGEEYALESAPPQGMCKVSNLYVNPETGKLVIKYEGET